MKKLFLLLFLIISIHGISQNKYRIESIISNDCNNATYYVYDSEIETKLISIQSNDYDNNLFYDNNGRLIKIEYKYANDLASSVIEYTYNSKGQLIATKSTSETYSLITTYNYNSDGTLISLEDNNSTLTEFKYNKDGLMEEKIITYSSQLKNKSVYSYENGNLIKTISYYDSGNGWQLTPIYLVYEYDILGNCKSIVYMQDNEISYKTDNEFYNNIKYNDVYYFVNPSTTDPTPSYNNAISKTTTYYSDGTSCTYQYTYDELSNPTDWIEENTKTSYIYPNPINNYVTIKGKNIYKVELYNALGMMLSILHTDSYENLDMSQYNSGVYYMKIYTDTGSSLRKIIKK